MKELILIKDINNKIRAVPDAIIFSSPIFWDLFKFWCQAFKLHTVNNWSDLVTGT
jgi:hypothetical protein